MNEPNQPQDSSIMAEDTPTHRLHMMQMTIQQIADLISRLQTRRAQQTDRIEKAKKNKDIARSLTVDKQFKKIVDRLEKRLAGIEDDLNDASDNLNRARALFFEASNGTLVMEKDNTNGNETVENR